MKLVFVSQPAFLDAALPFLREISTKIETHFFLEVAPESINSNILNLSDINLQEGIQPATPIFEKNFPLGLHSCWKNAKSFNLIVHKNKRSFHPQTWKTSHSALCIFRSINPDALYFDEISPRMAIALPGFETPPILLGIHDPRSHIGESNWRTEFSRKIIFPRVKKFILHNKAQINEFVEFYQVDKKRIISIPLGCYDIYRHWNVELEYLDLQTVLFFGRLSPYKGIEYFIQAAKIASEHIYNLRFVIAGKSIPGYSLPSLPKLQNGCQFELRNEHISVSEQVNLFSQASVVVCPYIEATQSGVILTAYAFGKPVIATRVGGLPEYIYENKTGFLISPNNSSELAKAILTIFNENYVTTKWKDMISCFCNESLDWAVISEIFLKQII